MKKLINIPTIFKIFLLIFIPFQLNGLEKIKPVFPFESLLNSQIYLDKLFKSQSRKQKIGEVKFGYNDSNLFFIKIYNRQDFVEFNSRFKQHFSINKFQIKIDSLHFSLKNYKWGNKDNLETLNPGFSYSNKNDFPDFQTKYQYFSNFDFHNLEFSIRKKWLEIPITISASKKYSYNTGFRFIKKYEEKIYAAGLNYSNDEKHLFPFLLYSFEKKHRYFFTSKLSLKQNSYPINSYFSEKSLFWQSSYPQKNINSILSKELKLNLDWQNNNVENRFNATIHSSEKSWKYIWSGKSFSIGTENKEIYTADLSYSLKRNSSIFAVKYHFGDLTDFKKEAEISFIKKIFLNDIDSEIGIFWIRNLKINQDKFSYPELNIKLNLIRFNSFLGLKYSYINDLKYPTKSNFYLSVGINF